MEACLFPYKNQILLLEVSVMPVPSNQATCEASRGNIFSLRSFEVIVMFLSSKLVRPQILCNMLVAEGLQIIRVYNVLPGS